MDKNIFDFEDYKAYLGEVIRSQPKAGHGFRVRLADAVGCQRAFVSQVLQGDIHFNLEHAEKVNEFLGHAELEGDYFLLMLQLARAGTEKLRARFRRQMQKIVSSRLVLKNRLVRQAELSTEDKQRYYSTWHYGAVRLAATVPGLQTREALAKRLKISPARLQEVLDFLVACGMLREEGKEYQGTSIFTHLPNDSALIAKHHTNWRMRTIASFDEDNAEDLHVSAVFSLSKKDLLKIKEQLVATVADLQKKVSASPEETLATFCLDWFEL